MTCPLRVFPIEFVPLESLLKDPPPPPQLYPPFPIIFDKLWAR